MVQVNIFVPAIVDKRHDQINILRVDADRISKVV